MIEDDRLSRVLVEETLSYLDGVELTCATTIGDGALLLQADLDFDLVLLDWRLDGRSAEDILDAASLASSSPGSLIRMVNVGIARSPVAACSTRDVVPAV